MSKDNARLIKDAKSHYKHYVFAKLDKRSWPDTMRDLVRALKSTEPRILDLETEVSLADDYIRGFADDATRAEAERDDCKRRADRAELLNTITQEEFRAIGQIKAERDAANEDAFRQRAEQVRLTEDVRVRDAVIERAHALYVRRCAETVDNVTEGEELFLAALSEILEPESGESPGEHAAPRSPHWESCRRRNGVKCDCQPPDANGRNPAHADALVRLADQAWHMAMRRALGVSGGA